MSEEYSVWTYFDEVEIWIDEYEKLFLEDNIEASFLLKKWDNLFNIAYRSRKLIEDAWIDKLFINFPLYGEKIAITKEMNSQKILEIMNGMKKILRPDFEKKWIDSAEKSNHWVNADDSALLIYDISWVVKGKTDNLFKLDDLIKVKMSKSQIYDFLNPSEENKWLWFAFFDEFIESIREDFIYDYSDDAWIEKIGTVFDELVDYFKKLFNSLYDFDERWELIALNMINSNKDKEINAEILIYEYLLNEAISDEMIEYPNKEIDIMSDKFRKLFENKRKRIFNLISLYCDFFMQKLWTLEQVRTLLQATSFYSQKKYDQIYDEISEVFDDETNF